MARMIIPTRNRPTSLLGVLNYLKIFHPTTELIIADGSGDFHKAQNQANLKALNESLCIDYRPYPADTPFFDRLIDLVKGESDECFIMGSDDDFPMMGTLKMGEQYLLEHPECVTALGALVSLNLKSDESLSARFLPARPIFGDRIEMRVRSYSDWPFPTTYAVTRREVLLERFQRARHLFLAGFYDFVFGVHDATLGTIHAVPRIGFISTRNYNHSYLRKDDHLVFLRRSSTLLAIKDTFQQDLMHHANLGVAEADALSALLVKRRISECLGHAVHDNKGFAQSRMFQNDTVQRQLKMFHDIFQADTRIRESLQPKLNHIVQSLMLNAKSQDNSGEAKKFETLEAQLANRAPAHATSQPVIATRPRNRQVRREGSATQPARAAGGSSRIDFAINIDPSTILRM